MAATYRLKGLGWFAGCVVVTLGFYLVSLQVAAERKKLEGLDARIVAAQHDIRSLETEFDTRANLAQLERWNGDTLALAAPRATQFVADEAQLASLDSRVPLDLGTGTQVKTAALVVPSAPPVVLAAAAPVVPAPKAVPKAAPMTVAANAPAPNRRPAKVAPAADRPAPVVAAKAEPARAKPEVAMLDRDLLSQRTLGDLIARARGERGGKR